MPSLVVINTDGESSEVELSPDQTEKDIKKFLTDSFKTKKQLDTIKQHILNKEKEDKDNG